MLAMLKPLVFLDWSTNAYHVADLGRNRPSLRFTNHYHRGDGLTTEPGVYTQYGDHWDHLLQSPHGHHTHTVATVVTVDDRRHTQKGSHGGGRYRKDFSEKIFLGRIAFIEHGGKTGRAMIKYPLYKKNNSRKNTLTYPGLGSCR